MGLVGREEGGGGGAQRYGGEEGWPGCKTWGRRDGGKKEGIDV